MSSMPTRFATLCADLNQSQRNIVHDLGLGSLLKIPAMSIQRLLLEEVAKNFNASDKTFCIGNHVVPISLWDVYCIFGLEDIGSSIVPSTKRADQQWFNLYRGDETCITFKFLEDKMRSGIDDDHFKRMFVPYAIGTILAPSSKKSVSSNYLELVIDVSRIKEYNWAQFTFDYLVSNLSNFKNNQRTGLIGNLALLQVWFFEHFQAQADCFDYSVHQHPLIRNCDEDTKLLNMQNYLESKNLVLKR